MADIEKVIKGLGECLEVLGNHCPERFLGYSAGACLDAIELLKAHVLSVQDIIDNNITPDIIWVELRDDTKVMPGIWVISNYEMQDGSIMGDLGEEIASDPEAYNSKWRVWDKMPTQEEKEAAPWALRQI